LVGRIGGDYVYRKKGGSYASAVYVMAYVRPSVCLT